MTNIESAMESVTEGTESPVEKTCCCLRKHEYPLDEKCSSQFILAYKAAEDLNHKARINIFNSQVEMSCNWFAINLMCIFCHFKVLITLHSHLKTESSP